MPDTTPTAVAFVKDGATRAHTIQSPTFALIAEKLVEIVGLIDAEHAASAAEADGVDEDEVGEGNDGEDEGPTCPDAPAPGATNPDGSPITLGAWLADADAACWPTSPGGAMSADCTWSDIGDGTWTWCQPAAP